jgi:hypothetical protein
VRLAEVRLKTRPSGDRAGSADVRGVVDAINKALAKAPPLTPAVRERILGLLS